MLRALAYVLFWTAFCSGQSLELRKDLVACVALVTEAARSVVERSECIVNRM
jgi:hypothetical protein